LRRLGTVKKYEDGIVPPNMLSANSNERSMGMLLPINVGNEPERRLAVMARRVK
jgi:hypothetical protein